MTVWHLILQLSSISWKWHGLNYKIILFAVIRHYSSGGYTNMYVNNNAFSAIDNITVSSNDCHRVSPELKTQNLELRNYLLDHFLIYRKKYNV